MPNDNQTHEYFLQLNHDEFCPIYFLHIFVYFLSPQTKWRQKFVCSHWNWTGISKSMYEIPGWIQKPKISDFFWFLNEPDSKQFLGNNRILSVLFVDQTIFFQELKSHFGWCVTKHPKIFTFLVIYTFERKSLFLTAFGENPNVDSQRISLKWTIFASMGQKRLFLPNFDQISTRNIFLSTSRIKIL